MATTHTLDQESNPWEQQAARFRVAAEKLKLDEGLWRVLQQPNREIIVHIPVAMDNGRWRCSPATACSTPSRAGPAKAACAMRPTSRWTKFARLAS